MGKKLLKKQKFIFLLLFSLCTLFAQELNVTDKDRELAERWYQNGRFYYLQKMYTKSLYYLEQAVKKNPVHPEARRLLVKVSGLLEGRKSEVVQGAVPEATVLRGESYQWYENGKLLYNKEEYEKAMDCFEKAYTLNNENQLAKYMYFESLKKAESLRKDAGVVVVEQQELKNLIAMISKKVKKNPETAYHWFSRGKYLFEQTGEKSRAMDCFIISLMYNEKSPAREYINEFKGKEEKKAEDAVLEKKKQEEQEKLAQMEKEHEKTKEELRQRTETVQENVIYAPEEEESEEELYRKKIKAEKAKVNIISADTLLSKEKKPAASEQTVTYPQKEADAQFVKTRDQVTALMKEASELFDQKKTDEALLAYEKAYKLARDYDPADLRAYVELFKIYSKQGKTDDIQQNFLDVLAWYQKPGARYDKAYKETGEWISCLVKMMVIQSAVHAYTSRNPGFSFSGRNFNIARLMHEGYLSSSSKKIKIYNHKIKTEYEIEVEGILCEKKNMYFINEQGIVECKKHGVNPFLKKSVLIREE